MALSGELGSHLQQWLCQGCLGNQVFGLWWKIHEMLQPRPHGGNRFCKVQQPYVEALC